MRPPATPAIAMTTLYGMCLSGTANCAGAAANGAAGTAPMPDGAAAVAATTTALSSRAAAAFCRFCGVLNLGKVCWVCA
jgi:hypothetical protein